jgi:hypothetical protein
MADQNKVYAFKVKEVYTKQAATEAEHQRGWNAEQNAQNPIWAVDVGQLGWVRDQRHDNGTWASVQLLGTQGFGWIPRRCIDVGAVKTMKTQSYIPELDANPTVYNVPSALSRAIGTLFQEMWRHSDALIEAGARPEDIKVLSQNSNYMDAILKGISLQFKSAEHTNEMSLGMENASTRSLFNDGQPAWDRLWSLPAITPSDNNCGIYAILYWVRKNDGTKEHHIYIGKSVDIARRYTKHHATIMGSSEIISSRNHYTIARLAISSGGGFRAVRVCFTISEKLHLKLLSTDYFRLQNGISTLCLVI